MLEAGGLSILTRRNCLLLAGTGLASWRAVYGFGGKEFWDTKEPSEWNADELARLLHKSPWANTVSAQRTRTQKDPMGADPQTTIPGSRSRDPAGMGGPRNRMPGSGRSTKTITTYEGNVVWESSAPVRAVHAVSKSTLPEGFDGQYVIGVSGVPLARSESKGAIDRLRQITTLRTKSHDPVEAANAQVQHENGTVYLFGFAREGLPVTRDDKEIVFTTHMGSLIFTAKFNPKDMLYHGELSV
jgi:hypothetical protein